MKYINSIVVVLSLLSFSVLALFNQSDEVFSPYEELEKTPLAEKFNAILKHPDLPPKERITKLNDLQSIIKSDDNPYYRYAIFKGLFSAYSTMSDHQAAADVLVAMDNYGKQHNLLWMQADAQLWQAITLARNNDFNKAKAMLVDVLAIAEQTNYQRLIGQVYNTRAVINSNQSKLYLALQDYLAALKIFEKTPDDRFNVIITSNISVIYIQLEEWRKAIHYNQKAIELYEEGRFIDNNQLALLYLNASTINGRIDDKNLKADQERYLKKAQGIAETTGNEHLKIDIISNLAALYLQHGKYEVAENQIKQCLNRANALNYPATIARCSSLQGELLISRGKFSEALVLFSKAEQTFKELEILDSLAEVYRFYSKAYQAMENYQQALEYNEQYHQLIKDILYNKRQQKLFALEEQYAAESKQQKIALLEASNALTKAKLVQRSLREKIWLILILFGSLIMAFLIRRHIIIQRSNNRLLKKNSKLYQESHHDALTGLCNRRFLESYLEDMKNDLGHYQQSYAVALIDVDHFKQANDTYGHEAGDEALKALATTLTQSVRSHDVVVRWGGEEFVIIFCFKQGDPYLKAAERIQQKFSQSPITTSAGQLNISFSMGITPALSANTLVNQWPSLLEAADKALYHAKASGRNCVKLAEIKDDILA
ncbi:tetratricopeptide repeat-containing diguanylate cyclase [Thalassotalea ganghwensis]